MRCIGESDACSNRFWINENIALLE